MINRRELLALAAGSAAVLALPSTGAAAPDWQEVVPQKPYQPYTFPFERRLLQSDMREVLQYDIHCDRLLRYDIAWSRDAKGRLRQMNCVMTAPQNIEALNMLRGVTLRQFQRKFDADKRIRSNLVPLTVPHAITLATPKRPEWWVAL